MRTLLREKNKILARLFLLAMLAMFMFAVAPDIIAQGGVKIQSLSEVQSQAETGSDTVLNIAKYVIAAVLGVGLIFVVYSLATSNPRAKEYVIGWIIAVVITLIAFAIV
jgi:heme/copper-type cytochrome/quinol oxidase subunit 4